MNGNSPLSAALLGVLVALGLAAGGYFIGDGLYAARASERFVTVRGFAEREVPADLVLWPITYQVTASDLPTLQARIEQGATRIEAFLDGKFARGEVTRTAPRVTDYAAQAQPGGGRPAERFMAEAGVLVRTASIAEAQGLMARAGELVKAGVALTRNWEYPTQYLFTQLESIKPAMIAAATKDARGAAEQFALDSGARVGVIRNAQQGLFTIEDRDPLSPEWKRVRVVTTIQYLLEER
ncbi:MAG: SIMPL domain-containing protein [Gammaproteobacteria bacterium]|nr:SIMPL domain-containing protein [Gammaproteobacteria bacterium]